MNKCRFILIFAAICLVVFSAPKNAFAKEDWFEVRSKNFYLIGNASDKDIRRVATKLEQFREVFVKLFPKMNFNSPTPTTVIVFKSGKAYKPYKPINADGETNDWVAGYFMPRDEINYITLSVEGEKQQTYTTIFHEYVHYLVNNNLGRGNIPPWFNEGIAEFYDQFTIESDEKVTLGGLNNSHLYSLQQTKMIPFDQFFNIDYFSLHQQGRHSANIYYAQSWALMHYLMLGNEGKRQPQMTAFLGLVMNKKPPREAFQQAFQTDYATMEKELREYVRKNSYRVLIYKSEKKMVYEDVLQSKPMSEATAKAHLGDLLYHSNRLPESEKLLTESLAAEPNSGLANTALGLVKMRQKKFDEAKTFIEKAIATDPKSHLAFYQHAYILSREGMNESNFVRGYSDESYKKMRESLAKAMTIKTDFAESYRLLAFINLVRNENLDEGISAMKKALQYAPGNQHYQLSLADLYVRKDEFDKAFAIIENVAKTADEPQLRSLAESTLARLQNYKQQFEAHKNQANNTQLIGDTTRTIVLTGDKPPTEEELKKLQADAEYETMIEALRKPQTNEKRIVGHLSKIQCAGGNIVYLIKSEGQIIKLSSKDFEGLFLMAYVPSDDLQFGCDTIKKDIYGIFTYKPIANAKAKTIGEIISIELVPETFKFTDAK